MYVKIRVNQILFTINIFGMNNYRLQKLEI